METPNITQNELENIVAHFRVLSSCVNEMLWHQNMYFKNRDKNLLVKCKKLEATTQKICNYSLSLEKVINIDTKSRERDLYELATANGF